MGKRECWVVAVVVVWGWLACGAAMAQTVAVSVPTLYRILFRHVNSIEAAAADLDSKKQAGGDELRGHYQKQLNLSDAETVALKSTASDCGKQLDAQEARALAAIRASKAKDSVGTPPGKGPVASASTKSTLVALEQERADISTGCAKAFQSGVAAQTAASVDVYVRTVIAGKTVAKQPPIVVPTQPLSTIQKGGH